MNYSTHTNIELLAQRLLLRWIPKWYGAFCDPKTGGFYERLGRGFQPQPAPARRLLTQCRQLAMYSHASVHNPLFRPALRAHFDAMVDRYHVPESGGWRFSVDADGNAVDSSYDLYALSFVIFSLSHYFLATRDDRAKIHADGVLKFIGDHFTLPGLPGYAEALDETLSPMERTRRQNPHMHLLEACLFAESVWGDPAYGVVADGIVDLFGRYFFIRDRVMLCEFFTGDLRPDPDTGTRVEPGHYCEWVWLLKKHAALRGRKDMHDDVCTILLDWSNRHGWDDRFGGIYDTVSPDGAVIADTKRLWPFTESLKANALMIDGAADRDAIKARMADMVRVFRDHYMQDRGFWVEWLNRDLSPATDYMPGTTPYHVYFGIMETREVIRGRGRSVSWRAGVMTGLYAVRRRLSGAARKLRKISTQ